MTRPRIAIPKAMYYYEQGRLWESFFNALGCDIVYSSDTNKAILSEGTASAPSEACLPVKVFMGHVKSLDSRADYIFIPSCASLGKNAFCCPELCALPDMARHCLNLSIPILTIDVDVRQDYYGCDRIARALGLSEGFVRDALESAVLSKLDCGGTLVPNALSAYSKIAVVGHPYIIYDPVVSMGLIQKLNEKGYTVITAQSTDRTDRMKNSGPFEGKRFWSEGYDLLGASCALMSRPDVTGLIFLTPFACGIDSMVVDFVRRRAKAHPKVRFMSMSVDEHTGQAGFDTRLEAFLDLLGGKEVPLKAH